jgi:hypothetical protein
MKRFLIRLVILISLPLIGITVLSYLYFKRDVYKDFRSYKSYPWKYTFQMSGDLSTKKLLHSTIKYNSFVFGSSRTASLYGCYLQKKIKNARVFHYANWSETIGGVYAKMRLLDSLGFKLENVFIYIDVDFTFRYDGRCNIGFDHYLLTQENKYSYYFNHYKSFVFPPYDIEKVKILLGNSSNYDISPIREYDHETNDLHLCSDSLINTYGRINCDKTYTRYIDSLKKCGFLYERPNVQKYAPNQISQNEEQILIKMSNLFEKHKSHYYIIITPLYDQLQFHSTDMAILKKIFKKNIYDFSGINVITEQADNYPDRKHFQHYISKMIVDSIVQ